MVSVRSVASSCLGLDGEFTVREDVFGYAWGPLQDRSLSLRDHLSRISGPSIDITVILVGHEPGLAGWFDEDDVFQIQSAIDWAREIYAQAGLGIRRIYWAYISTADANGYDIIETSSDATDLTNDWSGLPADSLDVFYVTLIQGAGGWSNTDGPCDKNADDVRTGSVIEVKPQTFLSSLESRNQWAGILLAHEMGHYLGLDGGTDGDTNIMGADDNPPLGVDEISLNSTGITNSQADTMLMHCSVKSKCA
jgi:hypothetical protein